MNLGLQLLADRALLRQVEGAIHAQQGQVRKGKQNGSNDSHRKDAYPQITLYTRGVAQYIGLNRLG